MKLAFAPMNEKHANDIASWHYDDIYSFHDMTADEDHLRIYMDTRTWQSITRAVLNENDASVGWASFYTENDEFWLSLGLRPNLTGQGLGEEFVTQCIESAVSQYRLPEHTIKLAVARFSQHAIKIYQRAGFVETRKRIRESPMGRVDFIEMEKRIAH